MKPILAILLCFALSVEANTYVSQNGEGGSPNGTYGNSYAATWLTTVANQSGITAGTTIQLTNPPGVWFSTPFPIVCSGNAGNPITFYIPQGMSNQVWSGFTTTSSDYCAIAATNIHDVTIDFGNTGGIFATQCGDGLMYPNGCNGIVLFDTTRVTIQNGFITNLCVRTSTTNANSAGQAILYGVSASPAASTGSSNAVVNMLLHDAQGGVLVHYGQGWTNFIVSLCTISNVNHGIEVGDGNNPANWLVGMTSTSNTIRGFGTWDGPTSGTFHHDAIIVYGDQGWVSNIVTLQSHIGPTWGADSTAGLYVSGNAYAPQQFNNFFDGTDNSQPNDAMLYFYLSGPNYAFVNTFNNTFIGYSTSVGLGIQYGYGYSASQTVYCETNNIFKTLAVAVNMQDINPTYPSGSPIYSVTADDDDFYGCSATPINYSATSTGNQVSLATWQGYSTAYDPHAQTGNPLLDSNLRPQSGSAAIANGWTGAYGAGVTNDYYSVTRSPSVIDIGAVAYTIPQSLETLLTGGGTTWLTGGGTTWLTH